MAVFVVRETLMSSEGTIILARQLRQLLQLNLLEPSLVTFLPNLLGVCDPYPIHTVHQHGKSLF